MRKSVDQSDTHQRGIEAQSVTLCPATKPKKPVPGPNSVVGVQFSFGFFLSLFLHGGFLRGFFFSMSVLATHSK